MKFIRIARLAILAVLALIGGQSTLSQTNAAMGAATDDAGLSYAICPIVYPLDQSPSERGFHYTFYGNGFFINDEGYLLTAAHVLSQLSDAQPYIVLRLRMAPPRLLKAVLIAIDKEHDVAILRALPNPFEGKYQVRFLPLSMERPEPTQAVLAAALRPSRLSDPHTFDALVEDRLIGQVLNYEFSQLDKGAPETELLLFSHEIQLGDSGAPVFSAESPVVVGLVEGRWLRVNVASVARTTNQHTTGVGAAVPVYYAVRLLQQRGVVWHTATGGTTRVAPLSSSPQESHIPALPSFP